MKWSLRGSVCVGIWALLGCGKGPVDLGSDDASGGEEQAASGGQQSGGRAGSDSGGSGAREGATGGHAGAEEPASGGTPNSGGGSGTSGGGPNGGATGSTPGDAGTPATGGSERSGGTGGLETGGASSGTGSLEIGGASSGTGGLETGGASGGAGGLETGGTETGGTGGTALLTGVETPTSPCVVPTLPGVLELPAIDAFPDPFTLIDGGPVRTAEDWACRRAEILAQVAEYEFGPKPPRPSSVTGSLDGTTLTVTVSEGGSSVSFTATIALPSGEGPFPAIITFDGTGIPVPPEVATITFLSDDVAHPSSARGQGRFYDLYGWDHPAGVFMAWAWGISRIIDALESTPEAHVDPSRIGVTGCSRYGDAALVAGAFDARVAITLPQESEAEGAACWRLLESLESAGPNMRTLSGACGEPWFREGTFCDFSGKTTCLPFDHHMLEGLVAPRGLLVLGNSSYPEFGAEATYGCSIAGREVWAALGVSENIGYSQMAAESHCSVPPSQQAVVTAFLDRFLLNGTGDTDVLETDGGYAFDEARWIDWETPSIQ
ncbi:MAG: hypothetical protein JW751_20520 [Polyangiaceae bacterium]|nr:hypothetical protein [Polyangiaceae bacterium]